MECGRKVYATGTGTVYGSGTGMVSGTGTGLQMGEWCRQLRSRQVRQSQNPNPRSEAQEWPGACTPAASDWPPLKTRVPRPPHHNIHRSSCTAGEGERWAL